MTARSSNGVGVAAGGACVGEFGGAEGGSGVVVTSSSLMMTLTWALLSGWWCGW
jgi:hypothetical protein